MSERASPSFPPVRLSAQDLTVARGGVALARGVSFTVGPGEALIVRGPNGAGKTSLMRMAAGLAPVEEGALTLADGAGRNLGRELYPSDAVAWLGHADGLSPNETPRAHVGFHARWRGGVASADEAARRVEDALAEFDVARFAHRPARRLSAGQRRRAALARVAASHLPLWLLDEPAAPLDVAGRAALAAAVARHRAAGGLVVAVAHDVLDWPDAQTLRIEAGGAA